MLELELAPSLQAADAQGWLLAQQQELVHRRDWLRMLAPRAAGGAELPLPEVVRLEEAIAAVDGSMGWVVTLCAGAGWFAGFMPPQFAAEVMATENVCLAGSGAPTGYADLEGDGYRISGCWDYASGAPMATHFTLNAVLRKDGEVLLAADGTPRISAFILPAHDVTILPTWRSMGLRATASHSYRVDGVFAGAAQAFTIDAAHATCDGPLYRFPFYPLAYITLGANLVGMARHFLELAAASIARRKNAADGEQRRQQALAALLAARDDAYTLLDAAWAQAAQGVAVSPGEIDALQRAALGIVALARQGVDELYPYCGLYAANMDSDINRVWRDFHTATQHALLLP